MPALACEANSVGRSLPVGEVLDGTAAPGQHVGVPWGYKRSVDQMKWTENKSSYTQLDRR